MAIVTLQQPYKTYRGRNAIAAGQVTFPVGHKNIARVWVAPFQPRSDLQVQVRQYLAAASSAWSLLNGGEVSNWDEYAKSLKARLTKDLVPYPITGKQAYVEINFYRQVAGAGISSTVPTALTAPSITGITSITEAGGNLTTIFTYGAGTGGAIVEISQPGITPAKRARANDIRSAASDIQNAFISMLGSPTTLVIADADRRLSWQSGDTVAARILPLSDDYVPGSPFVENLLTIA